MTEHLAGRRRPRGLLNVTPGYAMPDSRQFRIVDQKDRSVGYVGYWERSWRDDMFGGRLGGLAGVPGRGYATAAMRLLLDVIRAEPPLRPIHAFPRRQRRSTRYVESWGSKISALTTSSTRPATRSAATIPRPSGQSNGCSKVELAGQRDGRTVAYPVGETVTDTRKVRAPRRRVAVTPVRRKARTSATETSRQPRATEVGRVKRASSLPGARPNREQSDFGSAGARRSALGSATKTSGNRRREADDRPRSQGRDRTRLTDRLAGFSRAIARPRP